MPKRHSCGQFLCCTRQSKGASADESDIGSLEFPQEFPVHTIDLRDFKGKVPDNTSEVVTAEECNTSMEVLGAPSESVDEKGRRKEDSFSTAVQVDREEAKLERQRKKVERQRIRTLQCEEKLEKLKDRLTQSQSVSQRPGDSTLTGISQTNSKPNETRNTNGENGNTEETLKDNEAPKRNSPDDATPLDETNSETSLEEGEDEDNDAQNTLTKSNIATLERANTQLLENLHKKELEYASVQEEVRKVNEKLAKVREDHDAEMARFHSDLAKGMFAGPVKLEVGELEATVDQLEEKIKMMENFGEKLASSMESAAIGKWQSIEAEDTVHKQLLELIEEMRNILIQASQSKEHSEKTMALSNFETLYAQAMKLQVQMNNLRLSHLERNREIMVIKRQLLLQEVNNLLLQADITRKETELYQFQEAQIYGTAKRWTTCGIADRHRLHAHTSSSAVTSTYLKAGAQKEARPRQLETPLINIPYQSEEVTPQQPTCSPSALPLPAQTADVSLTCLPTAVGDQLHSSKSASCDQFTNQMENVKDQLLCSGAARGSNIIESGRDQKSFGAVDEQTTLSSPQFSEFANQVLSKKCPSEQLCVSSNEVQTAPTSVLDDSSKSDCQNNSLNNTLNEKSLLKSTELNTSASKKNEQIKTLAGSVFTTVCDSVPLHNEIAELRRVKRAVEKEAFPLKQKSSGVYKSTLLSGKDSENNSSVIADVTSDQSNQQGPREVEVPQALESDRPVSAPEYSPNAEFTQQSKLVIDSELEKAEPTESKSQTDDKTACNSSNSPGWRNVIPEQKENNEVQLTENCKASPRSSHCVTKGKPPLPRHVSPVRFTASGFPSIEKGPRSKSVGDVDRSAPESITSRPLQEVLGKSEKRSNTSETKDAQVGLEKAPGSTPQLSPRVGFVSRVRTIQPEADLLAERQRYMRGQNVHATEILQTPSFTGLTPEGDNQKSSSTEGHTLNGDNQKSSSTDGHTLTGDNQKSSSTDGQALTGDNQKSSSTDGHTLKEDNQKSSSTVDHTLTGDNQKFSPTDGQALTGDNQKSSSTDGHTLRENNQKSSSIDGHTLNGDSLKSSSTDGHTLNGDSLKSSSTDGHTLTGDNQKFGSTDGHTLNGDSLKSSSTDGHTLTGDNQKFGSTDGHTLREGNQKFGSTDDHTLTGNNQKFDSTDDHTPNGDNQNPSSTDGHTLNGDNQKSSSTDGHTLNGDNQKSSSIDDRMLNVENQKVSFTDDHTQNRDNQASSSTENENQNRGNQRSSPTHELTLYGDPQKSNFTNHRTLEIDDIQHKENVPHTYTDIQCKDKTLTRSPGSTRAISAIFHTSTEQMHSPTECVRNSNSQIPSKTLQDFGNTSHPLNEQVCERQEPISDLFISDAEGRSPVGNVYNSVHDKQYNKSSTSADTTQQHAQCDVLLPASSPEHPKSFSQSSIEDREAPLHESLAMSASHPLLLAQMPTDAKDHGISGDDHRNGARTSRSSKTYTKRNNDLVMHSKSAPASPCPLHAEVIKSKSKSERFYVEKVSSSGCLSSPSPSRTRRSRRHNETIEALCKQSISATLSSAVPESHLHETINATPTRTTHIQSDRLAKQDDAQLLPCNMETEATPSSPTPKEKRKSTILDTKWLQRSKKFFKISK